MKKQLANQAELIGFIYDPKTPPTAVIQAGNNAYEPCCVHSFRDRDLKYFVDSTSKKDYYPVDVWPNYKEYPEQNYNCLCYQTGGAPHEIRHNEKHCTKLVETA